jgi:hypothetical protein
VSIGNPAHKPSRPFLLAANNALWLSWKEFDGERTTVSLMTSLNNGHTWSDPRTLPQTNGASDHPFLVANRSQVFLSWQIRGDGYRLLPLEVTQ